MYRCFIDEEIRLNENFLVDKYNHVVNSLRMVEGDEMEVAASNGVFLCEILSTKNELLLRPISKNQASNESNIKISLYQCLAKGDKFDHVVRKAVELGVHEIYPVESSRTIVRLSGKKKDKKIERYQSISESAAEQSKRDYIPKVHDLVDIKDISSEKLLVAYEEEGESFKEALKAFEAEEISVLVGPEGGLEKEEVDYLKNKGAKVINFGDRILRTETAGLYLISAIQYELGDMG